MQYGAECTGLVVIRISREYATAAHCPGHGKCPDDPGRLLCCLSCGGSATCSARLLRLLAECLLEASEALRPCHPLERVGPFGVAIGNGRLYVLGWRSGLPWRMLRLLEWMNGGRAKTRGRVYVQRGRGGRPQAIRLGVRSNSFACVGVREWARDSGGKWVGIDD